jgi:hypothetical protein
MVVVKPIFGCVRIYREIAEIGEALKAKSWRIFKVSPRYLRKLKGVQCRNCEICFSRGHPGRV